MPITDERQNEQGESVPLNWACTVCGYHVEGELPERCPDCGADREDFEEVPIPCYYINISPLEFCKDVLKILGF
jgi:rubredoxin